MARLQVGITLTPQAYERLQAEATRSGLKPTRLATDLLERALLQEQTPGSGAAAGPVRDLLPELHALSVSHFNATLKLLRLVGLSAAEASDWALHHLKLVGAPPDPDRADEE